MKAKRERKGYETYELRRGGFLVLYDGLRIHSGTLPDWKSVECQISYDMGESAEQARRLLQGAE